MTDDTWTVWASSGEYQVTGQTVLHALADWAGNHRDDFVFAIVCDEMRPKLVVEGDHGSLEVLIDGKSYKRADEITPRVPPRKITDKDDDVWQITEMYRDNEPIYTHAGLVDRTEQDIRDEFGIKYRIW